MSATEPISANASGGEGSPFRVGVFLRHRFHRAILEPLARQLDREGCAVKVSSSKWDLVLFNPHVLVAAESLRSFRFHYYLPFTRFVHTRHGLASKGVAVESAAFSHYTCVTSLQMRAWYEAQGVRPRVDFWVTGYPQMDPLFRSEPIPLPVAIPSHRRVVLYAPTFQHGFTSIHMLGDQALRLLRGGREDTHVLIKPHPLIAKHHPRWLQRMRELAAGRADVTIVEDIDTDLIPLLKAADVLVTDVSSAMLEYLALDRPIILLTNPDHRSEPFYDPSGFEWTWRDAAEELFEARSLPAAIDRALRNPEARGETRRKYRKILYGDLTDGRSTERICRCIGSLRSSRASEIQMTLSRVLGRTAYAALHGPTSLVRLQRGEKVALRR